MKQQSEFSSKYLYYICLLATMIVLFYLFFKMGHTIGTYQAQLDCISVILK
jgi:hypothetical protein